jgi:hypothetical protein
VRVLVRNSLLNFRHVPALVLTAACRRKMDNLREE